jgi:hypothetical protein
MIGQPPECEAFHDLFGWPDAVVPIRPDGSDVAHVLDALRAEPSRLERIGIRNAREALLRHDWVYRWKQLLEIVGLEPTPRMLARIERLRRLADEIPGFDG